VAHYAQTSQVLSASGVGMMPTLFVFKLFTALVHKNARNVLMFGEVK